MKIKDKISNEIYEAESWKDWNGNVQYMKKGTNGPIRRQEDVEIIEKDKPVLPNDWGQFRREAAKDILCALMMSGVQDTWRIMIENAINGADELIKQLLEERK